MTENYDDPVINANMTMVLTLVGSIFKIILQHYKQTGLVQQSLEVGIEHLNYMENELKKARDERLQSMLKK